MLLAARPAIVARRYFGRIAYPLAPLGRRPRLRTLRFAAFAVALVTYFVLRCRCCWRFATLFLATPAVCFALCCSLQARVHPVSPRRRPLLRLPTAVAPSLSGCHAAARCLSDSAVRCPTAVAAVRCYATLPLLVGRRLVARRDCSLPSPAARRPVTRRRYALPPTPSAFFRCYSPYSPVARRPIARGCYASAASTRCYAGRFRPSHYLRCSGVASLPAACPRPLLP